ncbi:MAG: hypothetical protein RIT45_2842 [Pseudomonadota bacterium]|jgi:23S rRNA (adenine2503-C2)-methyltransferase
MAQRAANTEVEPQTGADVHPSRVPALGDLPPAAHAARWQAAVGVRPQAALLACTALTRATLLDDVPFEAALASLPRAARRDLPGLVAPPAEAALVQAQRAADATVKLLVRYDDGALVESVIIPSRRGEAGGRTTLCVSSQVGCGRRCAFCATGTLGLRRQLSADEIVAQLRVARRYWTEHAGESPPIGNIVFMGMGEPLDNLDAVCDAIDVLRDDRAFGLAASRITVSTVGVADRVLRFLARSPARIAVSLHAPDDARREALMPVNRRTGLQALKSALQRGLTGGREVLVAYILFDGLNDADADADLLAAWLDGLPARLNLIPANPGPDPGLRAPSDERVRAFQRRLLDAGIRALVRWPHGRDVAGACGQLAVAAEAR